MPFECSQTQIDRLIELCRVVVNQQSTDAQRLNALRELFTLYYLIKENDVGASDEIENSVRGKIDKLFACLQSSFEFYAMSIRSFTGNLLTLHESLMKREIDPLAKAQLIAQLFDSFELFLQELCSV